jgi:hypothetical protein
MKQFTPDLHVRRTIAAHRTEARRLRANAKQLPGRAAQFRVVARLHDRLAEIEEVQAVYWKLRGVSAPPGRRCAKPTFQRAAATVNGK